MSAVQPCIVLICEIKQSLPWAFLYKLNGVSGAVLLSAPWSSLYVLLPPHVWVNPAFYQRHHGTFTKRISELEWTGLETSSAKRAAHFYGANSKIITVACYFYLLQWALLKTKYIQRTQHFSKYLAQRECFCTTPDLNDKFSSSHQDPLVWFVLLLMFCAGLAENFSWVKLGLNNMSPYKNKLCRNHSTS